MVVTTAILWITAMSSFDEPDIGWVGGTSYFRNIADKVFGEGIYTLGGSGYDGIMNDAAGRMFELWFNLDEDAMTSFLDVTNDFDLNTIAKILQPSISSNVLYYVSNGLYYDYFGDSTSNRSFIIVTDSSPAIYAGTNGTVQTQNWDYGVLPCTPKLYINCVFESETVDIPWSYPSYIQDWGSIVPNGRDAPYGLYTSGTSSSIDYSDAIYKYESRVGAAYDTEAEYMEDYNANEGFTSDGIVSNIFDSVSSMNGMENDIDITTMIAVSACSNSNICTIVPPWCTDTGSPDTPASTEDTGSDNTTPTPTEDDGWSGCKTLNWKFVVVLGFMCLMIF